MCHVLFMSMDVVTFSVYYEHCYEPLIGYEFCLDTSSL